jgi:hypothetical protein
LNTNLAVDESDIIVECLSIVSGESSVICDSDHGVSKGLKVSVRFKFISGRDLKFSEQVQYCARNRSGVRFSICHVFASNSQGFVVDTKSDCTLSCSIRGV